MKSPACRKVGWGWGFNQANLSVHSDAISAKKLFCQIAYVPLKELFLQWLELKVPKVLPCTFPSKFFSPLICEEKFKAQFIDLMIYNKVIVPFPTTNPLILSSTLTNLGAHCRCHWTSRRRAVCDMSVVSQLPWIPSPTQWDVQQDWGKIGST